LICSDAEEGDTETVTAEGSEGGFGGALPPPQEIKIKDRIPKIKGQSCFMPGLTSGTKLQYVENTDKLISVSILPVQSLTSESIAVNGT
jgi:hypothetical protein